MCVCVLVIVGLNSEVEEILQTRVLGGGRTGAKML